MIKKTFFLASAILMALMEMPASAAAEPISPDGTYMFAQRDTCDLYLDVYDPAPESVTTLDGKTKPTVLFMFGADSSPEHEMMRATTTGSGCLPRTGTASYQSTTASA